MNALTTPWYAPAAYLYILALSDLDLAWEYLRRNAEYRENWTSAKQREHIQARRWGLRFFRKP